MNERVQFNTRIPETLVGKIKDDCDRNRRAVTQDLIVASALDSFFKMSLTERRAIYESWLDKSGKQARPALAN